MPVVLLCCSNSALSRVSSPSSAPTSTELMLPTSLDPMLCAVLGVLGCASAAPCCASPRCTASCAKGLLRPFAGLTALSRREVGLSGQAWLEKVSEGMFRPAARARDEVMSSTSNSTCPTLTPAAAKGRWQARWRPCCFSQPGVEAWQCLAAASRHGHDAADRG